VAPVIRAEATQSDELGEHIILKIENSKFWGVLKEKLKLT
jgi:hypothetical protein